jgi:hypothetical protein
MTFFLLSLLAPVETVSIAVLSLFEHSPFANIVNNVTTQSHTASCSVAQGSVRHRGEEEAAAAVQER